MSNKLKYIDIKNRTFYFFSGIINIKIFDPNNIKIDEKSDKNIFIYYIGYVTIKDFEYLKINSVNCLYLVSSNVKRYFEDNNGNKYLTLLIKAKKKYEKS